MRNHGKPILAAAAIAVLAVALGSCARPQQGQFPDKVKPTKNVIVMITDGTSTSLLATARWYHRYMTDSLGWKLNIDPYVCGLVQSRLSNAIIPDSAPAMSGYMTGVPSQKGNISIYPEPSPGQDVVPVDASRALQPAATVLEASRIWKDKATGVVVTTIFPHATPGATSAHTRDRGRYTDIAYQMASNDLDVCFGGGRRILTSEIRSIVRGNGATLLEDDVDAFRDFSGDKLWAIFNNDIMDFEIDRDDADEPSLSEMTEKAIEILSKDKDGFFLMVEGSKVDYGAHSMDPIEAVTEFIEFDKAVGKALEFAKKDGNTTVIVLPDHGNSGITLGDAHYRNYSGKGLDSMFINMKNYKASSYRLLSLLGESKSSEIAPVFKEWTGIELNPSEIKDILSCMNLKEGDYMEVSNSNNLQSVICRILTSRTHIGFTSGNHTGEDVFLAVYNPNYQRPNGIMTNTELNQYICNLLGFDEPLVSLSDRLFLPQEKVFGDRKCEVVEGEHNPLLVVTASDGRTLEVPAFRSEAYLHNGDKVDTLHTAAPAVYIRTMARFYVDASLGEF